MINRWKPLRIQLTRQMLDGKYKASFIFAITITLYVFRGGFWGVDFLALCYTLFLCIPFFVLFYLLSFAASYFYILIAMGMIGLIDMPIYHIFWILLMIFLYCFNFSHWHFRRPSGKAWIGLTKMLVLFILFVVTYEPLKATWYIETIIWVRLFILFAVVTMLYTGLVLLVHDIRLYQLKKRMKRHEQEVRARRRAI